MGSREKSSGFGISVWVHMPIIFIIQYISDNTSGKKRLFYKILSNLKHIFGKIKLQGSRRAQPVYVTGHYLLKLVAIYRKNKISEIIAYLITSNYCCRVIKNRVISQGLYIFRQCLTQFWISYFLIKQQLISSVNQKFIKFLK